MIGDNDSSYTVRPLNRVYDALTASEIRMYNYWRQMKLSHEDAMKLAEAGFNGKSSEYEAIKKQVLRKYGK